MSGISSSNSWHILVLNWYTKIMFCSSSYGVTRKLFRIFLSQPKGIYEKAKALLLDILFHCTVSFHIFSGDNQEIDKDSSLREIVYVSLSTSSNQSTVATECCPEIEEAGGGIILVQHRFCCRRSTSKCFLFFLLLLVGLTVLTF